MSKVQYTIVLGLFLLVVITFFAVGVLFAPMLRNNGSGAGACDVCSRKILEIIGDDTDPFCVKEVHVDGVNWRVFGELTNYNERRDFICDIEYLGNRYWRVTNFEIIPP